MFKRIIDSRLFIWALLALPSVPMVIALATGAQGRNGEAASHFLLHPTGEFSARFLVITMIMTPLLMLFPKSNFCRWLMRRRRYFGVAAFAYAAVHTVLYVVDIGNLSEMWGEFFELGIWTGWAAFFVFIPLALTSNDSSVRRMGRKWKTLQRFVYVSAVATLIHWIFVENNLAPALVHFVPLIGLEGYRIYRIYGPKSV